MPDTPQPAVASAVEADATAAADHAAALVVAGEAAAAASVADATAEATRVDVAHAAAAHAVTAAQMTATVAPLSGSVQRVLVWFDVVRGSFAALILIATIASYWHGSDWELPLTSAALLSMAWGYVMSLDPRSPLKAWSVGVLLVNFLIMELLFRWSAPTLAALAISGMTQYGFGRAPAPGGQL